MLNLNRASLSAALVNVAINDAIEQVVIRAAEPPRPYLGASIVGSECLRKVQYDWWCPVASGARARNLRARTPPRGASREQLIAAGFKFAPPEVLGFTAVDGLLHGHADGIIIAGPNLSGVYLNFPFLWEHKAINAKNWRALERDGLEKTYPQYAAQVAIYQAYLDVTNPALFTR